MTVLTCLWRRPELSALVMRYYAELGLRGVAVRSPGDPQEEVEGWTYVEHPNLPLGAKWNRGLRETRDDVMIVGSDDFVSKDYIERAGQLLRSVDIIECNGLYIYDDGRLVRCKTTPGAGRVISRRILEKKNWTLWEADRNRYLDASAMQRLQKGRLRRRQIDGVVLDVKTNVNLWRLEGDRLVADGVRGGRLSDVEDVSLDVLRGHFPDWVLECTATY